MKFLRAEPKCNKLSNCKSVGFRPGEHLRSELEKLADELSCPGFNLTISDILREGVTAFWAHIRAYMRARALSGGIPAEVVDRIVASGIRAHQMGLDPKEIDQALGQALAEKSQQ